MKAGIGVIIFLLFSIEAFSQDKRWQPDFATLQYAGSIGYLNIGAGYKVLKNKASLSLHYGYVPESKGGELNVLAARVLFDTYTFRISDKLQFDPLSAGLMVSYHFGSEFRSRWPAHRYPEGYYWWRTSLRAHLNTQTSLTHKLSGKTLKSLTYYLDLNANELYLASYFQNRKSLNLSEIVKVGYGIRATF